MRLLFDLDGVLANLDKKWYGEYNKDYGDDLSKERVKSWGIHDYVVPECGNKIYNYINRPGFFADLEVYPGAVEGLLQLHEAGHELVIVSAAVPSSYQDKFNWTRRNFPFISKKNIVFTHNKGLVRGHMLVDDGAHNLESFYKANRDNLNAVCVAMDMPYNQNLPFPVIRVSNIPDVVEYVNHQMKFTRA